VRYWCGEDAAVSFACTFELRRNCLLVATDDAHARGGEFSLPQRVHRSDALPHSGGHQALSERFLNRNPGAGPISPRCGFVPVHPRHRLQPVAEQMLGSVSLNSRAGLLSCLGPCLIATEQIAVRDRLEFDGGGRTRLSPQIERAGALADL